MTGSVYARRPREAQFSAHVTLLSIFAFCVCVCVCPLWQRVFVFMRVCVCVLVWRTKNPYLERALKHAKGFAESPRNVVECCAAAAASAVAAAALLRIIDSLTLIEITLPLG